MGMVCGEGCCGIVGENGGWTGDGGGGRYSLRASNMYNVKRYDITMKIAKIMPCSYCVSHNMQIWRDVPNYFCREYANLA